MNKPDIHQRFELMIKALGITKNKFSRMLGVSSTQVYNILNGRNAPSFDLLTKVAETFPSVSLYWLITGNGSVIGDLEEQKKEDETMYSQIQVLEKKIKEISDQMNKKPKKKTAKKA